MDAMWIWLIVALGMVGVEVLTGTFFFLFLAAAAVLAGFSSLLGGPEWQIGVFAVATLVLLPLGHRLMDRFTRHAPELRVGPERLVGEQAQVTEAIDPVTHKGMITVRGESWRAISDEAIELGQTVLVEEVKGNRLFVYREPVLDEDEDMIKPRLREEEGTERRLEIRESSSGEESPS